MESEAERDMSAAASLYFSSSSSSSLRRKRKKKSQFLATDEKWEMTEMIVPEKKGASFFVEEANAPLFYSVTNVIMSNNKTGLSWCCCRLHVRLMLLLQLILPLWPSFKVKAFSAGFIFSLFNLRERHLTFPSGLWKRGGIILGIPTIQITMAPKSHWETTTTGEKRST